MTAESSLPFDLTILRSFRVLRPLKLVSKVPSKLGPIFFPKWASNIITFLIHYRLILCTNSYIYLIIIILT